MNTKLKAARNKLGLTQLEVAEKAKVTVRAYQYYEYNERIPTYATMKLIAKALNSTVIKLF